jgi:hypothetical protein
MSNNLEISVRDQDSEIGLCLECHTQMAMDFNTTIRVRKKLYEIVPDKYCGQCETGCIN